MNTYSSKLLLFGEYTIIKGSAALAIPYGKYSGYWSFSDQDNQSNKNLRAWCTYLMQQNLNFPVKLNKFSSDIDKGLTFTSNIPQGYGVGSSGSLVAAFANEYVTFFDHSYNKKNDIFSLKNNLIQLENYFHGNGSGIDPLVCFLQQPLIFQKDQELRIIDSDFLQNKTGNTACFLINTHHSRKTEPLVSIFHEKCKTAQFEKLCAEELTPNCNQAIDALITNDKKSLFSTLKGISQFQFEHFKPMILDQHLDIWVQGIASNEYLLKLCGAGGGGFILGFTKNWTSTQERLKDYDLELVFTLE